MARRRAKKTVKQPTAAETAASAPSEEPTQVEDKELAAIDQEVERQCAAIRAIRNVEIEHSLTGLRLLRSYFNQEQLQIMTSEFFKETLPNLSIVKNGENGEFEVKFNDRDDTLTMNQQGVDGGHIHASLLRRLSMAYASAIPSLGGFDFSSDAAKAGLLGTDNLQIQDYVLDGPPDSQMLGMHDGLRTPGVSSQRLSIGMTPKTLRLPKPGEMLLSVHGSPLGVYKEENMEAINESEEG